LNRLLERGEKGTEEGRGWGDECLLLAPGPLPVGFSLPLTRSINTHSMATGEPADPPPSPSPGGFDPIELQQLNSIELDLSPSIELPVPSPLNLSIERGPGSMGGGWSRNRRTGAGSLPPSRHRHGQYFHQAESNPSTGHPGGGRLSSPGKFNGPPESRGFNLPERFSLR